MSDLVEISNDKRLVNNDKRLGRPPGAKNKSPQFRHYRPKKWEPWMSALVLSHIAGNKSNVELAEMYEISATHVSNILSTEEAKTIEEEARKNFLKMSGHIGDRMTRIAEKAVERFENFVDNDTLAQNSPVSFIRETQNIFKMTFPQAQSEVVPSIVQNNQNNIFLTQPELIERIEKGLDTANRIAVIHNETRQKLLKASGE